MENGWRSPRSWLALLVLVVACFGLPHLEDALRRPPARWLHLHTVQNGVLVLGPLAWEMTVRLALDIGLSAAILRVPGRPFAGFPIADRRGIERLALGSAIGLTVMIVAILAIVACGAARVSYSTQSAGSAALHGLGWFAVDLLGAAGEELFGRGSVLLVAAAYPRMARRAHRLGSPLPTDPSR